MTVRCPACNAYVDDKVNLSAGHLRCEKCGMRFSAPRIEPAGESYRLEDDSMGLGIHPALVRKYRGTKDVPVEELEQPAPVKHESMPAPESWQSVQLSPSLTGQTGKDELLRKPFPLDIPREERTRVLAKHKSKERSAEESQGHARAQEKNKPPTDAEAFPKIAGYQISSMVGKGAMGQVYKGTHSQSGEAVAIKVLAKELAARQDFIARFEREAAALAAVDHTGVVSILGSGHEGDLHYLCMPYIDGVSMRRYMGQAPFPAVRSLELTIQILMALSASHEKRVIHRDLKPENIIVHREDRGPAQDPKEKLVLVDFGLAGMGDNDPHPNLTKSRMTMGTVNYMAPEQRTDAKRVGPPADIYAAGVILYELLTGDLPLGRFKLPSERQGLAHLSKKIDASLGRALDRDPAKRFADAKEFALELQSILNEMAQTANRDTVPGRADARAKAAPLDSVEERETNVTVEGEAGDTDIDSFSMDQESRAKNISGEKTQDRPLSPATGGRIASSPKRNMTLFAPKKRHQLIIGCLALVSAVVIGIVMISDQKTASPLINNNVLADANKGPRTSDLTLLPLKPDQWVVSPLGWGFDGKEVIWKPSSRSPNMAQQATATYRRKLTNSTVEAAARIVVASNVGEEESTKNLQHSRYGGIFFTRGQEGVGLAFFANRNCFFLRWQGDSHEPIQPVPCGPGVKGRIEMRLRCQRTEQRKAMICSASIEGKQVGQTSLRIARNDDDWTFFLGCHNAACGFRNVRAR